MAKMNGQDTARWVTAEALAALARVGFKDEGMQFSATELACWTQLFLTPVQRVHASSHLCKLGYVRHEVVLRPMGGTDGRADMYTLTRSGARAVQAADEGAVLRSGPKGAHGKPRPAKPGSLATRLWNLLRMRRMLDSDSAASLLANAGSDEFERVRANARKYFKRWAKLGAVEEGARRDHVAGEPACSNGVKRYVLVKDSLSPPTPNSARVDSRGQA